MPYIRKARGPVATQKAQEESRTDLIKRARAAGLPPVCVNWKSETIRAKLAE